jgi:hypothetical protein
MVASMIAIGKAESGSVNVNVETMYGSPRLAGLSCTPPAHLIPHSWASGTYDTIAWNQLGLPKRAMSIPSLGGMETRPLPCDRKASSTAAMISGMVMQRATSDADNSRVSDRMLGPPLA